VTINRSRRKTAVAAALVGLTTITASATAARADSDESISIGVLELAQVEALDVFMQAFMDDLSEQMAPIEVTFDVQNANGDQSLLASIARDFASSDHDAFAVVGTPAVVALAQQEAERPIFAVAMGDPVGAGIAETLERPGGNVTGSYAYADPFVLTEQILEIQPGVTRIGTVFDPSNQNIGRWISDLRLATDEHDVELVEATITGTGDVATASRSLLGRVHAIMIGPDPAVTAGLDAIGAAAIGDDTPLYVVAGDAAIPGVLANFGADLASLGTAAADVAVDVLNGADPAVTAFAAPNVALEITFNQATLDALDFAVPADVAEHADIVG
jgi:putative ABC transport system substrate-binding protein